MGKPIHSMWTGSGSPLASDVGVRPGPGQSEFSTPLATVIAQGQAHGLRETRICSGLFCPETKGRMLSSQCGSTHNHVESWASDNHGDFSNILCQKFFLPWLGYLNHWFKHLLRLVKDKDRAAPGPHGLRGRWSGSAPVLTRNETASPGWPAGLQLTFSICSAHDCKHRALKSLHWVLSACRVQSKHFDVAFKAPRGLDMPWPLSGSLPSALVGTSLLTSVVSHLRPLQMCSHCQDAHPLSPPAKPLCALKKLAQSYVDSWSLLSPRSKSLPVCMLPRTCFICFGFPCWDTRLFLSDICLSL